MRFFPERLREIRGDIAQDEFSKKIGVSRASLSYYENGSRIPDITTLKRIHEVTGVSIYYLLGLTNSKDDAFATTQQDTGLSEQAISCLTTHPDAACIANIFLSHKDFPDLAHQLMIAHDNQLIADAGFLLDDGTNVKTTLGTWGTEQLKMNIAADAYNILHSVPNPLICSVGYELPYIAAYQAESTLAILQEIHDQCDDDME